VILVVCALAAELRFYEAPAEVALLAAGVGPVESAIAISRALARTEYDAVIHAGIAGAYRDSARVGDVRLVVHDTLADFGLEGGGTLALPDGTLVASAAADPGLVARIGDVLPQARGLTVTAVTATEATGARLRSRYGHDVETMEGFAILRACEIARVRAVGVRGISNYIGDRASSAWDFAAGARATATALAAVVGRLTQVPA